MTNTKPETDWSRAADAAALALHEHRLHRRRGDGDAPYINHVAAVAMMLASATEGADGALVAAGSLHDLPPKSDWTHEMLSERFGDEIASVVMETQMDRDEDRELRRQKEIDKAPSMVPRARMLKLADKTSSVRGMIEFPPPGWGVAKKEHYLVWAEAVAEGCAGLNDQLDRWFREAVAAVRAGYGDEAP